MDWHKYIESNNDIAFGKPVVRGTRLSVEFLFGLFAAGWTHQDLLDNYAELTPEVPRAVVACGEEIWRMA